MKRQLELSFTKESIDEAASQLLLSFQPLKIFLFNGNLGAGKTTLITAICRRLGSLNLISSPTFSIINEYKFNSASIFHFDLYRLKNLEEAMDIGLEEYIYSGNYCFIEWPEKVTKILPKEFVVHCELSYIDINKRLLKAWEE